MQCVGDEGDGYLMEWVKDGNRSVCEVLEMDSKSVGDLGKRIFVEIGKKGFGVKSVGEKEIIFKQFLYELRGHAGYHSIPMASVGSTKKGKK